MKNFSQQSTPNTNKILSWIYKIIINLFLVVLIILITEAILLFSSANKLLTNRVEDNKRENNITQKITINDYISEIKNSMNFYFNDYTEDRTYIKKEELRKPSTGKEYKDETIVISGCSYVYGENIKYEETFGVRLAGYLKKYKVYNIAINGGSPRETLFILRNYDKYTKNGILPDKVENTKYFIYVFINDQKLRLRKDIYRISPHFRIVKDKQKNERLEYYVPRNTFFKKTYINKFFSRNTRTFRKKIYNDLSILYITEMKREVEKVFPNAEFICFLYDDKRCMNLDVSTLRKNNVKIIDINDISDIDFGSDEYKIWDNFHPNGKAWEEIVPLFVKKADIK